MRKLAGHVGFDSLPDQLVNKSVQQGFVFNIMCIGETGLGKSTLMDTLFNTNFDSAPSPHSLPNVNLKSNTYELQESNVKLKVNSKEPKTTLLNQNENHFRFVINGKGNGTCQSLLRSGNPPAM